MHVCLVYFSSNLSVLCTPPQTCPSCVLLFKLVRLVYSSSNLSVLCTPLQTCPSCVLGQVDGKDVRDLESKVAAAAIRNSGEKVKLALGRMQSPRAEWAQISNTSLQQPTQRNTFNIDEFTDQGTYICM